VFRQVFKDDLCAGFDPTFATSVLLEEGWLLPGSDGKSTQKKRLPGIQQTTRVYVFGGKMWGG
jgi:putative DNA primase/helicase